jgi:hypothetical protein
MKNSLIVFYALFVAAYARSVFPAMFIVPPDREMIRRSHAIVVGEALTSWLMNGLTLSQASNVTTVSDLNWGVVAPR